MLNTLRYIHANPKAAGVRKGFYDPYSNYGHYGRLEGDGLSEWHPSFLRLASSLWDCSRRYEWFCQQHRYHAKGVSKCHWEGGDKDAEAIYLRQEDAKEASESVSRQDLQPLPFVFDVRLNPIPHDWHELVVRFR